MRRFNFKDIKVKIVNFRHIIPHPLLKGYIEKLWILETEGQPFDEDLRLIVPNDRMKIAIPYKNAIVAEVNGKPHFTKQHTLTLTGMMDMPFKMNIASNNASGTICAEFSAYGAYSFFHMNLGEVKNTIISVSDILGNTIADIEEQIANAELVEDKVFLFQEFLLNEFLKHKEDTIFEFCVQKIKSSEGRVTIKELEKQTGYSSRWIYIKFIEKLGISPKNLASIIRFQHFYEILCNDAEQKVRHGDSYYDYYYDQSHFIKDFKRFTGLTPAKFQTKVNDWGKIFYNA